MTLANVNALAGFLAVAIFVAGETSAQPEGTAEREHIEQLHVRAETGDAEAQTELGRRYSTGDGVPRDYEKGIQWYRPAAEQGDVGAMLSLGHKYETGRGVNQDETEAYFWYNLAAVYAEYSNVVFNDERSKLRGQLTNRLTPEQRADAQQRARLFIEAHPPR